MIIEKYISINGEVEEGISDDNAIGLNRYLRWDFIKKRTRLLVVQLVINLIEFD